MTWYFLKLKKKIFICVAVSGFRIQFVFGEDVKNDLAAQCIYSNRIVTFS